jgi:peptide/nickel transport system permease protein
MKKDKMKEDSFYELLVRKQRKVRIENFKRTWYRFSRNKLSVFGLSILFGIIILAIFADYLTPYPHHAELYINFSERYQPPSLNHLFGTDMYGRDVFSRTIFGFRYALMMVAVVLSLVVPIGVILGLIAGYYRGTWIESIIVRISEVFVALPPLVLALSIASVLEPNVFNAMMAVSLMWWPWYVRLVYSMTSSLRNEPYILAVKAIGEPTYKILFKELLPNMLGPILTKVTLDAGWVIIIGAAISFVGLGAQPPTPDLGTMVSEYGRYLPEYWWMTFGPAFGIVLLILSFNLIGDGVRDAFASE